MFKELFSKKEDEQKVLDAIMKSALTTMRVIGRGTLTVNTKEVTQTEEFKKYAKLAQQIVQKHQQTVSEAVNKGN